MYNILIVDDEIIMCDFLEKIILDLKAYNVTLTGIAHDAGEAMDIICGNNVHLVITDIVMSGKNGIELMEQALQYNKNIKFIILSGYDDFRYVQTAYRLGVLDYILKTSMSADYIKTLILGSIPTADATAVNTDAISDIGGNSYREKYILQQNSFSYFFTDAAEKNPDISADIIPLSPDSAIRLLYITLFIDSSYISNIWKNDYTSIKLGFSNIMQELIDSYGNGFLYAVDISHYALVLNADLPFQQLFAKLLATFKVYFDIKISGFISDSSKGFHRIFSLYNQCTAYAPYYFYIGKNILYTSRDCTNSSIPININLKLNDLRLFFESSSDAVLEHIEKLAIDAKKHSISDFKKLYLQYAYSLENFCQENNIPTTHADLFFSIRETGDWFEYNKWLKDALFFVHIHKTKNNDIIDQIKKYIEENCNANITLDTIAAKFNISKWYFCRLFQQKTNKTFNNYLSLCRIEKAKKMLGEQIYKISTIASECGYSSTEHFSRSFKKATGISPSQYKKDN